MLQQSHLQRNRAEGRKQRLYRFFHSLLHHYSIHNNIYYLLLFWEILQFANYALHASFPHLWNSSFATTLQTALSYTDLSAFWPHSPSALLTAAVISVTANAAALALLVYEVEKDASKLEEPNILGVKFVTTYGILLKSVLLLPMMVIFSAFAAPGDFGLEGQSQAVLGVLSVIGFGLMLINLTLFVLFLRDNSPFSRLPFAASVGYHEELRCGVKLLAGIYGSLSHMAPGLATLFCVIYALLLAGTVYYNYYHAGLLDYPINRISQLAPLLTFWIAFCSLLQMLVTPNDSIGLLFCLVGIFFIPFAWAQLMQKRRLLLLTTNFKAINNSADCLAYNYECIRLADHPLVPHHLLLLQGLLNYHISHCKKPVQLCICHELRQKLSNCKLDAQKEQEQAERKLWFQFIRNNLLEVREKHQEATQIRFLLAYIENEVLGNKFRSLHSLEEARERLSGYKFEFLDYHYVREVERRMETEDRINNEKKPVDINRYYHFEMGFGKLQQLMEESTYQHLAFWEVLKSDKASRTRLFEEGQRINLKLADIQKAYYSLTHLNPNNIHCLVLFANFMKVIVNSSDAYQRNQETIQSVKRSLAQSGKMQGEVEKEKYGDNSVSAIVIVSGERSNIGIIKHCNWKVSEIIGYAPHQLLGQNINLLMPKFIGNMHDDVLRNYLELSQSQYDYVERLVPMIDARNFMVLARVLTKPLPSLLNGLELVGIFNVVTEANINHPGEIPKFVLYRSDTGQVQALSESCFSQFHYKINRIDENNETSSELTFSTLFLGVRQNEIIENQGHRCRVLAKTSNSSDLEQIPVEVFQRLQIYYYSVRLRLLYFYTLKSYRQMEETLNSALAGNDPLADREQQWQKQPKTERSAIQDKAVKEKFLHQMSKKNALVGNEPTALRLLRICGYLFFLGAAALSVTYIILHTQTGKLGDYLSISSLSGETIGDLCEINYNARLMQLGQQFPSLLSEYSAYQGNITVAVNSLQNGQFDIEKIYLGYGDYSITPTKEWVVNQNGQFTLSSSTLDSNVFDYVTAASSYNQVQQSALSFPLNLRSPANVTQPYMDIFKIRFTGLFETIPSKLFYQSHYFSIFVGLFDKQIQMGTVELCGALGLLLVGLAVVIPLWVSVLRSIEQTILLFGHMSRSEIDKEIENCNSFLEIFYQDSYLVRLKRKQQIKQLPHVNHFAADQIQLAPNTQGGGTSKILKSFNNSEVDLREHTPSRNTVKASVDKIQFLEKQLHLRTEAQILINQSQQQNQNQLLRVQVQNSEEEGSVLERLASEGDTSRAKAILLSVGVMIVLGSYFVAQCVVSRNYLSNLLNEISHLQQGYANVNYLKMMKLYALESLIDNTLFYNYQLLNVTAGKTYSSLYAHQRQFDTIALPENTTLFPYYYTDLCQSSVLSELRKLDNLKIFPASTFSENQCRGLMQGVLEEGLRLGIVAYAETLLNFTKWNNVSQLLNSSKFQQVHRMQKYLEPPLRAYIRNHKTAISDMMSWRGLALGVGVGVFMGVALGLFVMVWKRSLMDVFEKLRATRLILGFIPVRVFIKNAKLTREYEKYIGDLME